MAYRIRLEGQKIELEYGSMSSVVKIMFKIDLWTFDSCVCLCQRQKNHTRKRDKVIDIHQLCTISPNSHLGVTPAVKDRFTTGRRNSNRQFNSSTCYMASFEFARFVSKDLLSQTCHRRANVIGYPTVVYRRIVASLPTLDSRAGLALSYNPTSNNNHLKACDKTPLLYYIVIIIFSN